MQVIKDRRLALQGTSVWTGIPKAAGFALAHEPDTIEWMRKGIEQWEDCLDDCIIGKNNLSIGINEQLNSFDATRVLFAQLVADNSFRWI